jgi:hypothetical protein
MTRKDYELIAGILNNSIYTANKFKEEQGKSWVEHIALEFADSLGTTNPRFDRDIFLTACGVK